MLESIGQLGAALGLLGLAAAVVVGVVAPMVFDLFDRRP